VSAEVPARRWLFPRSPSGDGKKLILFTVVMTDDPLSFGE